MIPGIIAGGAGGGPASFYWNPADVGSGIVLSDSNKVATNAATPLFRIARSVTSHDTGKWYAELVLVSGELPRPWNVFLGIANASESLTGNFLGQTVNSYGLQTDDNGANAGFARLFHNSAEINRVTAVAAASYVRVAIDFDAGEAWIGNPSAYVLGGDPAAGTTPSFTFTPGAPFFLGAGMNATGGPAATRARTAPGDMVGSIPAGFSAWG